MRKKTKNLLYLAGGAAVLYYFLSGKNKRHAALGQFAVGAGVPPGGDYSFTRAPGFNSKEY